MRRAVTISVLFGFSFNVTAQYEEPLSYAEQLEAVEAELDSLSIFNLIDSLFNIESLTPSSELNVRFAFTSSVTSAGRDYDLNQTGYSIGLSYYHKSGFYGDLSVIGTMV